MQTSKACREQREGVQCRGASLKLPPQIYFSAPPPGCIRTPSPASLSPLPLPACWHLKVTAAYAWVDRVSACGCAHTQGPGKGGGAEGAPVTYLERSAPGGVGGAGGGASSRAQQGSPTPPLQSHTCIQPGRWAGEGTLPGCQRLSAAAPTPPAARWGFLRPLRPRSATEEGNGNV